MKKKLIKLKNRMYLSSRLSTFLFFCFCVSLFSVNIACAATDNKNLKDIFDIFIDLINKSVIPLLFTLAIVVFIWGVIQYMMGAADQTKREEGRKFILWGIIGIFVMVAIWGIIAILTETFGVGKAGTIQVLPVD